MGEYERGSTAVLNAYVAPRTVAYLRALNDRLRERGLSVPLLLIQSNGGAVSVEQLGDRPVTLLLSGPAAGVGALQFYADAIGSDDLISMEIGGTSCDVILMSQGDVAFTDMLDIGGYHVREPVGRGAHASAPAAARSRASTAPACCMSGRRVPARVPGPACYGLGGTRADDHRRAGRARPAASRALMPAGGHHRRRLARTRRSERAIARPLGLDVEQAASGMIRLMDQKLLHAVQRLSTERGHDPRRFTLVAAGGAGPLHGAAVGRALGCRRVYVPRLSGAFCALGMLHADMRHDYVRMHIGPPRRRGPRRGSTRSSARWKREANATLVARGLCRTDGPPRPRARPALPRPAMGHHGGDRQALRHRPRSGVPSRRSTTGCSATSSPAASSRSPSCA